MKVTERQFDRARIQWGTGCNMERTETKHDHDEVGTPIIHVEVVLTQTRSTSLISKKITKKKRKVTRLKR